VGVPSVGRMGGVGIEAEESAEEQPSELERPVFARMEVDPTAYYEPGEAQVGIGHDGMPVMGGDVPLGAEPGLAHDNLICASAPGRPRCDHYVAVLVPAEGIAKGFKPLRRIRRLCKFLATASEPWEITGDYYACTARSPADLNSGRLIEEFEAEQKKITTETAEESGSVDF
jgi:hypothetical protein